MDVEKDYYAVLGVLPTAEVVVIRAAYKALAQRYHPDRNIGTADEAHRKMAEINEAFQVLSSPEIRQKYDEIRGAKAHDASSFFDDSSVSNNSINDPLAKNWETAIEFYPDLIQLEKNLLKVSAKLAFSYKAFLLESKQFDDRKNLASTLEQNFLELFFGNNPSIVQFAKVIIERGEKVAAKALNEAISVLGTPADPTNIINRISRKYNLNFSDKQELIKDEQELIKSFKEGSWATASTLLRKGVNPVGLRDEIGKSLADLAKERGDNPMLGLLKGYGDIRG